MLASLASLTLTRFTRFARSLTRFASSHAHSLRSLRSHSLRPDPFSPDIIKRWARAPKSTTPTVSLSFVLTRVIAKQWENKQSHHPNTIRQNYCLTNFQLVHLRLLAGLVAWWLAGWLAGLLACLIVFAYLFLCLIVDCVCWVFRASSLRVSTENRDGRPRRAGGTIAKCKGNISKWFGLIVFRWWFPLFPHYFKPRGTESEKLL